MQKIGTFDNNGVLPLAEIARQADIASQLSMGGYLLAVRANMAGGSTYSKQNFWTFFGAMPFYVSAGVLTSYVLIDGRDGTVVDAATFEQTEGFMSIDAANARYLRSNTK